MQGSKMPALKFGGIALRECCFSFHRELEKWWFCACSLRKLKGVERWQLFLSFFTISRSVWLDDWRIVVFLKSRYWRVVYFDDATRKKTALWAEERSRCREERRDSRMTPSGFRVSCWDSETGKGFFFLFIKIEFLDIPDLWDFRISRKIVYVTFFLFFWLSSCDIFFFLTWLSRVCIRDVRDLFICKNSKWNWTCSTSKVSTFFLSLRVGVPKKSRHLSSGRASIGWYSIGKNFG